MTDRGRERFAPSGTPEARALPTAYSHSLLDRASVRATDLVTAEAPRRCVGVAALDSSRDAAAPVATTFLAPSVVLATGGLGALYEHTSNPAAALGEGVGLALRAGVAPRMLEYARARARAAAAASRSPRSQAQNARARALPFRASFRRTRGYAGTSSSTRRRSTCPARAASC